MRQTLKTMNPAQAREHYAALTMLRYMKAEEELRVIESAPAPLARSRFHDQAFRRLVKAARTRVQEAIDKSRPHGQRHWQTPRARDLQLKYGTGVAAAFLAAHHWKPADAWQVLFPGKPIPVSLIPRTIAPPQRRLPPKRPIWEVEGEGEIPAFLRRQAE